MNEDIDHLLTAESPELSDGDGDVQINPNLGLETVGNLKYADSGIDEINHSHELKDTTEWSKKFSRPRDFFGNQNY